MYLLVETPTTNWVSFNTEIVKADNSMKLNDLMKIEFTDKALDIRELRTDFEDDIQTSTGMLHPLLCKIWQQE